VHRSTVGALSIDLPAATYAAASAFWQAALGRTARPGTTHEEFEVFTAPLASTDAMLQRIGSDVPGVHLDLYTDDLEAEVARLVALGATDDERVGGWAILRDPAGMRFCVVPVPAEHASLQTATVHE
jgi:hypothetical protein